MLEVLLTNSKLDTRSLMQFDVAPRAVKVADPAANWFRKSVAGHSRWTPDAVFAPSVHDKTLIEMDGRKR